MFHASDKKKIITNTDTFTHSSYKKESENEIAVIEFTSNEAHN